MNRMIVLITAAASATLLAACVPSTYGYGQYGGYGQSRYGNNYGNDYHDPYRNSGSTFRCESEDHRVRRCNVNTSGGVRLVRQESDAVVFRFAAEGAVAAVVVVTAGVAVVAAVVRIAVAAVAVLGGDAAGQRQGAGGGEQREGDPVHREFLVRPRTGRAGPILYRVR